MEQEIFQLLAMARVTAHGGTRDSHPRLDIANRDIKSGMGSMISRFKSEGAALEVFPKNRAF